MTTEAQMREQFAFLNIRNIRYEPMGALIWADTDKGTMRLADLRGWGHLTGHGQAWGLDAETARKVQDAIGHVLAESFAAHQSATEQVALAIHDRDHAERQLAKVAAENMRLREATEQMKLLAEAASYYMERVQACYERGESVRDLDEATEALRQALANIKQQEKKND